MAQHAPTTDERERGCTAQPCGWGSYHPSWRSASATELHGIPRLVGRAHVDAPLVGLGVVLARERLTHDADVGEPGGLELRGDELGGVTLGEDEKVLRVHGRSLEDRGRGSRGRRVLARLDDARRDLAQLDVAVQRGLTQHLEGLGGVVRWRSMRMPTAWPMSRWLSMACSSWSCFAALSRRSTTRSTAWPSACASRSPTMSSSDGTRRGASNCTQARQSDRCEAGASSRPSRFSPARTSRPDRGEQALPHGVRQLVDAHLSARAQHDGVTPLRRDAQGDLPVEEHGEAGDRRGEHRLEVVGGGEVDRDAGRQLAPHPRLTLARLVAGDDDDEAVVLGGRRHGRGAHVDPRLAAALAQDAVVVVHDGLSRRASSIRRSELRRSSGRWSAETHHG